MEAIAMGAALGLFAGILPGAFLTLVAATALQRGLRQGITVALLPLGTELPVLLVSVLVLTQVPEVALRWLGVAGGGLLLYMAWRLIRESGAGSLENRTPGKARSHYLRMTLVAILSPSPWVFWLLIGGPLLLNRWRVGPTHGIAFAVAFLVCFVGVMAAVAWASATGRARLDPAWRRRVLFGAGWVLVLAGVALVWQSWIGNFTEMVRAPETFRDRVL